MGHLQNAGLNQSGEGRKGRLGEDLGLIDGRRK